MTESELQAMERFSIRGGHNWPGGALGALQLACAEIRRLQRCVLNQAGDNLCWITDPAQIPPKAEFLKSCERYHAQIAQERGELTGCLTIAQLEEKVLRLELERLDSEFERRAIGDQPPSGSAAGASSS